MPGRARYGSAITRADAGPAGQKYNIFFKVSGTIALESALPDLSKSMNLSGSGARRLTVRRDANTFALFSIFVVDSGVAVRITGMTIANAITTDNGSGGGINNNGTLTVSHTTIFNNTAGVGGGIYNSNTGRLKVTHATISGNTAQDGAGIENIGTLTVSHTTFFGNPSGVDSTGGGIDNFGTLTVSRSTISHNGATKGGGIYNNGTLALSHTTISNVGGGRFGGGIYNNGTATVSHAKISSDQATDSGGGVYNARTLMICNTTVSGNSVPPGFGPYPFESHRRRDLQHQYRRAYRHPHDHLRQPGLPGCRHRQQWDAHQRHNNMSHNSAGNTGGGINNTGTLTESRDNISQNTARFGGGVYNSGGGRGNRQLEAQ